MEKLDEKAVEGVIVDVWVWVKEVEGQGYRGGLLALMEISNDKVEGTKLFAQYLIQSLNRLSLLSACVLPF